MTTLPPSSQDASPSVHSVLAGTAATRFMCSLCGDASFTRRHGLSRHIVSCHSSVRAFRCALCTLSFPLHHQLTEHARVHLPPSASPSYDCSLCSMSFSSRRSRQRHQQSHVGGLHRCLQPACGRVFVTLYAMRSHQRTHAPATERGRYWLCGWCGRSLASQRGLEAHVQRRHRNISEGDEAEVGGGGGGADSDVRKRRKRGVVESLGDDAVQLERERKRRVQESSDGRVSGLYRLVMNEAAVTAAAAGCGRVLCQCGSAFANRANLQRHQRSSCSINSGRQCTV